MNVCVACARPEAKCDCEVFVPDTTPPAPLGELTEDQRYVEALRQAKYRGFDTLADLIVAYDRRLIAPRAEGVDAEDRGSLHDLNTASHDRMVELAEVHLANVRVEAAKHHDKMRRALTAAAPKVEDIEYPPMPPLPTYEQPQTYATDRIVLDAPQAEAGELVIGASRVYNYDGEGFGGDWFREFTLCDVTFLAPLDKQDEARHILAALAPQRKEAK